MQRGYVDSKLPVFCKPASFHRNLVKDIELHKISNYLFHGLLYPEVGKRQNKVVGLHKSERVRNSLIIQKISMVVTLLISLLPFFLDLLQFDGEVAAVDLAEPFVVVFCELSSGDGE